MWVFRRARAVGSTRQSLVDFLVNRPYLQYDLETPAGMYDVAFAPGADAAFDALSIGDAIEILQKLDVVEQIGVQTEVAIAIVNGSWSVHLLSPPCLPSIITIHDRSLFRAPITVTHIEIISGLALDYLTKRNFASEAAAAVGVVPAQIHVL